jgi:hypothetical protein
VVKLKIPPRRRTKKELFPFGEQQKEKEVYEKRIPQGWHLAGSLTLLV